MSTPRSRISPTCDLSEVSGADSSDMRSVSALWELGARGDVSLAVLRR
jgi:hypothetical protein